MNTNTNTTVKHTFFIGLNDRETHVQVLDTFAASNVIENIFFANGIGATITQGRGVYRHEDGSVIIENTVIVYCYEYDGAVNVQGVCNELKRALNQESIAVESCNIQSALY